jgi:hypothetical protein
METDPTTRVSGTPTAPPPTGGFPPGTILANRYRIVSLLAVGGMGAVYRADDIKLSQPVALKFVSPELAADPSAHDRLITEARSARTIAHPNVCRVYDVGEIDGRLFLTMEYVDGEDLASLLRRIGRLPPAKALDIARELCAGLAAAHDRGVLHHDLKPANVMIDGRGHARITDFGLAVERGRGESGSSYAGTMAYMSPERLHGAAASVRSDLYGLGLILYEISTGRPAFTASSIDEWRQAHDSSAPAPPSELSIDVDPAMERVILRCLEKDPSSRPASAAQVAAALPGGDPLAAAIAAGETPSPELVAASGEEGTLPRRTAWVLLFAGLLGLAAAANVWQWTALANLVPFEGGPDALQVRARAVLRSLGYDEPPRDHVWDIGVDPVQRRILASRDSTARRFADAARITPTPLTFMYRQSPVDLRPLGVTGHVSPSDPAPEIAGDALACIDTMGHLTFLRVVPPAGEPDPGPAREPDWRPLLAAAGLADADLTPAAPRRVPPIAFDARQAWTGTVAGDAFRLEAAAFRGRVVFAERGGADDRAVGAGDARSAVAAFAGPAIAIAWFANIALVALVARRNVRMGRGDRRGARRVAAFVLFLGLATNVASRHWVPDVQWVWDVIRTRLGWPLFRVAFVWLAYLAIEPLVRRAWPQLLIAWTRLLDRRWRDPLVGRALLGGVLLGTCTAIAGALPETVGRLLGLAGTQPFLEAWSAAPGAVYMATVAAAPVNGVLNTLAIVAIMVFVRAARRPDWVGLVSVAAVVAIYSTSGVRPVGLDIAQGVIIGIGTVMFLRRYGLLALAVGLIVDSLVRSTPWTFDMGKWFVWRPVLTVILIAALAVWGFRNVLGRQSAVPVFKLD